MFWHLVPFLVSVVGSFKLQTEQCPQNGDTNARVFSVNEASTNKLLIVVEVLDSSEPIMHVDRLTIDDAAVESADSPRAKTEVCIAVERAKKFLNDPLCFFVARTSQKPTHTANAIILNQDKLKVASISFEVNSMTQPHEHRAKQTVQYDKNFQWSDVYQFEMSDYYHKLHIYWIEVKTSEGQDGSKRTQMTYLFKGSSFTTPSNVLPDSSVKILTASVCFEVHNKTENVNDWLQACHDDLEWTVGEKMVLYPSKQTVHPKIYVNTNSKYGSKVMQVSFKCPQGETCEGIAKRFHLMSDDSLIDHYPNQQICIGLAGTDVDPTCSYFDRDASSPIKINF